MNEKLTKKIDPRESFSELQRDLAQAMDEYNPKTSEDIELVGISDSFVSAMGDFYRQLASIKY